MEWDRGPQRRRPSLGVRVILFEIATLTGILASLAPCGVLPGGIKHPINRNAFDNSWTLSDSYREGT
jgi:hypothetical protein